MKTFDVSVGVHRVEMEASLWTGKETVRYDGTVRSEKRNFAPFSVHSFEVEEDGERIVYEVNFVQTNWGPGFALRRNGLILAHEP